MFSTFPFTEINVCMYVCLLRGSYEELSQSNLASLDAAWNRSPREEERLPVRHSPESASAAAWEPWRASTGSRNWRTHAHARTRRERQYAGGTYKRDGTAAAAAAVAGKRRVSLPPKTDFLTGKSAPCVAADASHGFHERVPYSAGNYWFTAK